MCVFNKMAPFRTVPTKKPLKKETPKRIPNFDNSCKKQAISPGYCFYVGLLLSGQKLVS